MADTNDLREVLRRDADRRVLPVLPRLLFTGHGHFDAVDQQTVDQLEADLLALDEELYLFRCCCCPA